MTSSKSDLARLNVESHIFMLRGQRVMLDTDLARLYGVTTFRFNEQVKRNRDRFPDDFAYQLTQKELRILTSQNAISSATHGGRRTMPWVFTEQGVAMLSSVLRSPMAVKVNIEIMRAFVRLRRLLATPGELVEQIQRLGELVNVHDHKIKNIMETIEAMLQPPPAPPRGRFGFYPPEKAE